MKVQQALQELSREEIETIALKLKRYDPKEKFSISWLINGISDLLTNSKRFTEIVFNPLDIEIRQSLIKLVFQGKKPNEKYNEELKQNGIVINGEVPEEINNIIIESIRPQVVKEFPHLAKKVSHSLFLKFILLLSLLRKENVIPFNRRKPDKSLQDIVTRLNLLPQDKLQVKQLISYLLQKKFVDYDSNKIILNKSTLKKWFKQDKLLSLKEFYKAYPVGFDILSYLKRIAELQLKPSEWVDMEYLPPTTVEHEKAQQLGAVLYIEKSNRHFVQLSPEGWYLVKEEYPSYWNQKILNVSADFELFIPHDYDPYLISFVGTFGALKDNEFLLVYDINPVEYLNGIDPTYREFLVNILERRSRYLPDVVRYELRKDIG